MEGAPPRRMIFFAFGVVTRSKQGVKTGTGLGFTTTGRAEDAMQEVAVFVPVNATDALP